MRPWTVDADDIQLREDFDAGVLHHTPGVDDFLDPHGNRFFVLGTKGLGKTLLLKARRLADQDRMLCLPRNSLIDKPIGDPVMGADMISLYGSSTENWGKLWRMAIVVATLKAVGNAEHDRVSPRLAGLLEDRDLSGVMDHFVQMLDLPRSEFFRATSDVDKYLIPRIRGLKSSVAIFIDSVDEYFNNHIAALTPSDAGELSPDIWYFSQMGLVEAAYELRRLTHHLKVFASIRKEAFDRFGSATPMVQQYRGSTVDIRYTAYGLTEIFKSNIARERPKDLADESRRKEDLIAAFLGLTEVTHSFTGEVEQIDAYILRHTLGRPRDLMTIGGALSRVRSFQRDAKTVKAVVNEAATEIAQEYISEISPFSGDLDLDGLFLLLPRNVMTADDAEAVTRRYHRRVNGNGGAASEQGPLEFLYGVGLLGVVSTDHVDGRKSQQFLRPGQQSFDTPAVLPRSSHYFIHPILTDLVGKVNQDYIHNVDRTNIIGDGLPWKDGRSEARLCVMKADIRGFSALMEAGDDSEIHMLLHDIVQAHAAECPVADVVEGDSLIIAHENPRTILTVAKRIMQDLNEAPGNPELRVGIDHGVVEMHAGRSLVTTGTPFRVAARLEPHAAPGQILATASFAEALNEQPGMYRALPVNPDDAEHPGQLNIKKPGSEEPDEFIEAYRIVDSV